MLGELLGSCSGAARELLGSCSGAARELLGSCSGAARELLGSCSRAARELLGSCSGAARELLGSCSGAARLWALLNLPLVAVRFSDSFYSGFWVTAHTCVEAGLFNSRGQVR